MTARNRHLINVLSTGILVTLITFVVLFWARWYCHMIRVSGLNEGVGKVRVSPTGLFPFENVKDPNLASPSSATAELNGVNGLLMGLGAPQYIESHVPGGPGSCVYRWELEEDGSRLYFDPSLGLMVYARRMQVADPNGAMRRRYVTQYAGPEGVAERPDEKLDRFVSPITDGFYANNPQTVYDSGYRRFFAIRWRDGSVKKGPELTQEHAVRPIQMGILQKNRFVLNVDLRDPQYKQPEGVKVQPGSSRPALHSPFPQMQSYPVLVLNSWGRIDLLNPDTLELTPGVGTLPRAPTLFPGQRMLRSAPDGVPAYCVYPVCGYQRESQKRWAYGGYIAAAASPDLTGVRLAAFDPNAHVAASEATYPGPDEIYFSLPGASLVTVVQYILENLHPLASLALSSLTASQVPATSAYQSLVLLPNSFVAMAARDAGFGLSNRIGTSLLLMLPAIGLGVLLAWRVSRDAARMGLSRQARTAWILGTFVLGLPAYVTYRLTRPNVALVTCPNCGLGRRPDFEKCQRCGSAWVVPELVPPAWRVIGEPEEQPCDEVPSKPEETISPA
jgi:hypothetical protein